MSKVKIEGNASGTGTFTISAPNSNTDRNLTLPDGAGEILTDASSLPAANLTGTLPAIDGSSLTGISSGWTPISTVSTGTASYVEFALSSSYETFVIVLDEVQISTGARLYGTVSTDSGSTYQSTDYFHHNNATSTTHLEMIYYAAAHQSVYADAGISGNIEIFGTQPNDTVSRFTFNMSFYRESSLTTYPSQLSGMWGGTSVVNKIKIYPEAGNFTDGKMTLYGLAGA